MKVSFKKSLIVAGLAAAGISNVNAVVTTSAQTNDKIIIGCTAPSAGTAGALVYSVDAISSNPNASGATISLPSAVAFGQSCTGALNTLLNANTAGTSSWTVDTVPPGSLTPLQTGSSYALQTFTLHNTGGTASVSNSVAIVGCAAPATGGALVYSVDASGLQNSTIAGNLAALTIGSQYCSQAVTKATGQLNTGNSGAAASSWNVYVNGTGYALTQYLVQ